jgi:hypothetical protein
MSTPTKAHTLLDRLTTRLADLDQLRLEALERRSDFRSVTDLASAARQAARLEGERVVIFEVQRNVRYLVANDFDLDIEKILWAALSGASMEAYTSSIDAVEYARGQREALTWIRHNVVPRDYDR